MLKIVVLGSAYPLRGGLATYNERITREFQSQGHEARISTFSLQYPNFLFPGKSQYSDSPKPDDLDISVEVNSINPLNWIKVGRKLKKEAPDLIIVKFWLPFMGPCLGTICRIAKSNGKTKVISIIDNIIPHEKRPGDRLFAQYFANNVDAFVCMSKSVLTELKQFTKQQPALFNPHPLYDNFGEITGREEALNALNLVPNFRYLLFFGFIRDYKGLDIFLEAMSDERLKQLPVKALVAGEFYSDPKPYHELIAQLGIESQLELRTDFIADEEVQHYFNAADMVVQPYKSATQSGVTQICYHFCKPMLVTDVGGLAEIVPHEKVGYVCEVNARSVADSLVDFFENERMAEFSKNTQIEKEQYSWEQMTAKIYSLLDQIRK